MSIIDFRNNRGVRVKKAIYSTGFFALAVFTMLLFGLTDNALGFDPTPIPQIESAPTCASLFTDCNYDMLYEENQSIYTGVNDTIIPILTTSGTPGPVASEAKVVVTNSITNLNSSSIAAGASLQQTGSVSGNKIWLVPPAPSSTVVGGALAGGASTGILVTENKVYMSTGTVNGWLLGGGNSSARDTDESDGIDPGQGGVKGNEVYMAGGTVLAGMYGGSNTYEGTYSNPGSEVDGGVVEENKVWITGGTIGGATATVDDVVGGVSARGDAKDNEVYIQNTSSSPVTFDLGGVNVTGGLVFGNINIGFVDIMDPANNVKGHEVSGNYVEIYSAASMTLANLQEIIGGELRQGTNGLVSGNTVKVENVVSDTCSDCRVYGGYFSGTLPGSGNTARGGFAEVSEIEVFVDGADTDLNLVYGGGSRGVSALTKVDNNKVTITGGATVEKVTGGIQHWIDDSDLPNEELAAHHNQLGSITNNTVSMEGGTVTTVIAGDGGTTNTGNKIIFTNTADAPDTDVTNTVTHVIVSYVGGTDNIVKDNALIFYSGNNTVNGNVSLVSNAEPAQVMSIEPCSEGSCGNYIEFVGGTNKLLGNTSAEAPTGDAGKLIITGGDNTFGNDATSDTV
jgi:hypothetical protein